MTCQYCDLDPCLCPGRTVQANDWVFQECRTDGCTTMIRSKAGKQLTVPVCKWCTAKEQPVEVSVLDQLVKRVGKGF